MATSLSPALDDSLTNKAAPAGSMRYFALLYTPAEKRDAVTALYVIDAEIRESAQSPNHDVAHTRLQWWRQEIDRLVNNNPQHPATRLLNSASGLDRRACSRLHELVVAADMDLARMTYLNMQELRAYCSRSGGVVQELIAALLNPEPLSETDRKFANGIGVGVREAEILRDLRQDACDGRLHLPLDQLEKHSLKLEDLRGREVTPQTKAALSEFRAAVISDLNASAAEFPKGSRSYLRHLFVLAALHRRLLDRIASRDYDVATQRIDLGPIEKPWVAWRTARKAN